MKTNPGGQIAPDDVFGRDAVIAQIWRILEGQSIYMNSERRIGKSTVLAKLHVEPKTGWWAVKRDLEGIHTTSEFAGAIYKDVDQFLGKQKRAARRFKEFLGKVGGVEIGGVFKLPDGKPAPWKTVLEETIHDLNDASTETGERMVFLWDEVPFMIDNIRKREGEASAMEVLDFLRYLRQTYPALRMVLTGSVGLHHIVTALKQEGYANAPINDMAPVDIGPIASSDGGALASALLAGEGIQPDDMPSAASAVSELTGHIPYYVHHLIRRLKFSGRAVSRGTIEETLVEQLCDPNDPWELKHYRDRIGTYYGSDDRLALAALDAIAAASVPVLFDLVFDGVKAAVTFSDKERLRRLLTLLQRDHYIRRDRDGAFEFSSPIVRRWWRIDRGL